MNKIHDVLCERLAGNWLDGYVLPVYVCYMQCITLYYVWYGHHF